MGLFVLYRTLLILRNGKGQIIPRPRRVSEGTLRLTDVSSSPHPGKVLVQFFNILF
jgi:hypothetical protein